MSKRVFLRRTEGKEQTTRSNDPAEIAGLSVTIELKRAEVVRVALVVPDTWSTGGTAGVGAQTWYAISLDDEVSPSALALHGGVTTFGRSSQRTPIALERWATLGAGKHVVRAMWWIKDGEAAWIGANGRASLIVEVQPEGTTLDQG